MSSDRLLRRIQALGNASNTSEAAMVIQLRLRMDSQSVRIGLLEYPDRLKSRNPASALCGTRNSAADYQLQLLVPQKAAHMMSCTVRYRAGKRKGSIWIVWPDPHR